MKNYKNINPPLDSITCDFCGQIMIAAMADHASEFHQAVFSENAGWRRKVTDLCPACAEAVHNMLSARANSIGS